MAKKEAQKSKTPSEKPQKEQKVLRSLSQVKVLVSHAGPHGSYIQGDKAIIDSEAARQLEKSKYVEILSTATEVEQAVTNSQTVEKR